MNDKDKEAFKEWYKNKKSEFDNCKEAWKAACEYKREEYSNIMDAMTQTSQYNFKLQAENKKLREALELTIKTAEYVYQPNKPLEKGLPPFYYHTLSYEGDLELIEKTIAARKLLDSIKE